MSYSLVCVHASLTTEDVACPACLAVHLHFTFLFNMASIAPGGLGTYVHDVASHTSFFQASLISSSHCPVQTACAHKHVATHASSCSGLEVVDLQEPRKRDWELLSCCAGQLSSQNLSFLDGATHTQSFENSPHTSWHNIHAQNLVWFQFSCTLF